MARDNNDNADDKTRWDYYEAIDDCPEFSIYDNTDSDVDEVTVVIKSGQEIPKGKGDSMNDVHQPRASSLLLDQWHVLKDKVRSVFFKPKRDAFIASFFDFDQNKNSHT